MTAAEVRKIKRKIHMLRAYRFIKNKVYPGKIYHLFCISPKIYVIKNDNGKIIKQIAGYKEEAVYYIKKIAKKAFIGQAYIYKKDGTLQTVHTFVNEVAKERRRRRQEEQRRRAWLRWYGY